MTYSIHRNADGTYDAVVSEHVSVRGLPSRSDAIRWILDRDIDRSE